MVSTPDKIIASISPYYKKRAELKKKGKIDSVASREYELVYDSPVESLEPIYFWI